MLNKLKEENIAGMSKRSKRERERTSTHKGYVFQPDGLRQWCKALAAIMWWNVDYNNPSMIFIGVVDSRVSLRWALH